MTLLSTRYSSVAEECHAKISKKMVVVSSDRSHLFYIIYAVYKIGGCLPYNHQSIDPVVLLASMLNYLYSFIPGLTAMSLKNNTSIIWLNDLFLTIAGGAVIPMEFYPAWLNRVLDFLPFKYIVYWPIQFFLNKETIRPPQMMLRMVLLELLWIIVLYIVYKIMWRTVTKKFCSAGG